MRFKRSYVSYPVCCPSRATYLTGQYAHNHGVMGLYPPTGGYGRFDKQNTLPVWLQRAGYHTVHLGKFLNGYGDQEPADVPPGWSDWYATVDYSTYSMWGYTLNENGRMRTYGRPFGRTRALPDRRARAEGRVDRRGARGRRPLPRPLNLLAPHHEGRAIQRRTGSSCARRHGTRAVRVAPPRRAPELQRARHVRQAALHPPPRAPVDPPRRAAHPARRRSASASPAGRRRRRRADRRRAARTGELDDTYIVFTSDNGYMQGEHGDPLGEDAPVRPVDQRAAADPRPRPARGAVSNELVVNVDLAPTLLELAGARAGKTVDGRSLLPFARHPGWRTRRAILHETGGSRWVGLRGQDEPGGGGRSLRRVLTYRAVRLPGWLYVRYHGGARELYDLRRDPHQLESVHADPRYRRTRRVLGRELRRLVRCARRGAAAGPAVQVST